MPNDSTFRTQYQSKLNSHKQKWEKYHKS
jgi:hypothetical protein